MGAIGRLTVLPNEGLILDLKGVQYAGSIIPCCTVMVVGMSGAEARVESMVSDFVQLEHLGNVLESLDGALTSGVLDPSLLEFDDVACSEAGGEGGSGSDGDGDGGSSGGGAGGGGAGGKKKAKKKSAGKRGGGSDDDGEGGESSKEKKKKKKVAAAAMKGAYGRKVTVKKGGKKRN